LKHSKFLKISIRTSIICQWKFSCPSLAQQIFLSPRADCSKADYWSGFER
jgi:hypothetical protein